ncbi:uncharacterized protein LY79DRAFT_561379 [Colletotrichum navitas]|uniref:Uncharacterized protein n=1 Tax=Colletotrichum navitas TaxID=681940 RepID=A0AAD8PTP2_9PEZI|nr:uncharacterized protein LY79DRAFT_561379 [Colletotrichum navitas]KAK1580525.1 hypothetical protein LY79DRAFT_561379 [Colletotrichum navitas]
MIIVVAVVVVVVVVLLLRTYVTAICCWCSLSTYTIYLVVRKRRGVCVPGMSPAAGSAAGRDNKRGNGGNTKPSQRGWGS